MKRVTVLIPILLMSFVLVLGSSPTVLAQSWASGSGSSDVSQGQLQYMSGSGSGSGDPAGISANQSQVQNTSSRASSNASSKASVNDSGNALLVTGDSVSTNVNPRQFAIPGSAPFAYIPSYFGPATADVNWQTMKTMAHFKLDWSASDAEALLKGAKLKSKPKCLVGAMAASPAAGSLRVAVNGDSKNMKDLTLIGTNDVWSKNVETTTREILGQAILDGLKMGADTLLVTGEGAAVVLKAFGWGIGISNSVSVVTGTTGNVGNVSAGGIGVSGVEAGYHSKPWLQVLYFKGPPPPVSVAPAPPPVSVAPPPAPPAPPVAKPAPPVAKPAPPVAKPAPPAAKPAPPVAEKPAPPPEKEKMTVPMTWTQSPPAPPVAKPAPPVAKPAPPVTEKPAPPPEENKMTVPMTWTQ
jgi:hypothetical protein